MIFLLELIFKFRCYICHVRCCTTLNLKYNSSFSFSTIKAYNVFLGQLELIARDHEIVAEGLQEKVAERLKSIHKETTNNRKNVCVFIYGISCITLQQFFFDKAYRNSVWQPKTG